jgi:hypothetical protein
MTATPTAIRQFSHRHLITPQLWDKLVLRLMAACTLTVRLAEEVLNETLGFLRMCAEAPQERHYPPPLIAQAWCIFLTYTRDYEFFCQAYAGRFIHHEPPAAAQQQISQEQLTAILSVMRRRNITINRPEIWQSGVAA